MFEIRGRTHTHTLQGLTHLRVFVGFPAFFPADVLSRLNEDQRRNVVTERDEAFLCVLKLNKLWNTNGRSAEN